MGLLRQILTVVVALAVFFGVNCPALAGGNLAESPLGRKAMQFDRALITPAHTTAEQHHLIAVRLAAHHTQVSDPAEILRIMDELGVMVTYLAQSDTTFWWDGFQWVPSNRTTNTYSGTNLTEEIMQSTGDGITWVNETRTVNAYDGGGRLSSITTYT